MTTRPKKGFSKVVCSLAFAIACGGAVTAQAADAAKPGPLKIGASFQEINNPYFVTMKNALEEAGASIGAKLIITDARHDVSKQVSDVEDMLQKGIDILLINPTDSVGVQSAVKSAHAAGVVVVAVDAQAEGPLDSFVGSKNFDAGFQACEYLAKHIGDKGNIAILDGIAVVPILERVRGCKEAVAKHPDIKIVSIQNGKQERDQALTVTENMLQAQPTLKGIFSVNDNGSLGALSAIEASGLDVKLVSVDGAPEAIKAIQKPGSKFIATSAQYPRDQIRLALGIALAKKHGAWLSMDIYNTDYTQSEGKKNGVLEDNLRKDREIGDIQRENFKRAHAAGVKMVFGTDAGVHPHGGNGKQFAVMVQYGMTPLQAIQSATINAAEALARKDVGIIEPGRYADLVAVEGDPTVNVRLLEAPAVVIQNGTIVKRLTP